MDTTFYTANELKKLGLKSYGSNVLISKKASIYEPYKLKVGNNVRIDDFCIISGNITIGSYVHISAYVGLYGSAGIEIGDFSGISPRCTVFSVSDDFSGEFLIGPMIPGNYTNVKQGLVKLKNYVQIGAGCIILPSVTIGEGTVTGAMSLINKDLDEWKTYAGIPCKVIKERKKDMLQYVKNLNL